MTELFMITGPAGSGKTTLGVALADRIGAPVLDLDDVALELVTAFRAAHPEVGEADALRLLRDERYAVLADSARAIVRSGSVRALVLIAPFTAETSSVSRWERWLRDVGVAANEGHLVWVQITSEERLRRLAARGESRDAVAVAAGDLPETPAPQVAALVVDGSAPLVGQVDAVLQRFGNG